MPGHERFVPTMLAGVGPVPAVLFVVAADEGWMPQSAEHLAALDALGVRHGLLAVTRADLADPGPAPAAARERARRGRPGRAAGGRGQRGDRRRPAPSCGPALGGWPAPAAPDPTAPVRLWVDRAFTHPGQRHGGDRHAARRDRGRGDELLLTPAMAGHGARAAVARPEAGRGHGVARVALNLRGIHRDEVGGGWP